MSKNVMYTQEFVEKYILLSRIAIFGNDQTRCSRIIQCMYDVRVFVIC